MTKSDSIFPAFSSRFIDFAVQFSFAVSFHSTRSGARVKFDSGVISWTNQNYFATHSNQWDCFIYMDNRLRQMAFFVFVKVCGVGSKGRLSRHVERFWNLKKKCFFCGSLFLYYSKQIDSMLPWVCSVIDHRRRQNVVRTSVTHSDIASCATFLFLPHFDVICDILLNRRTITWNLFVNCKHVWKFRRAKNAMGTRDIGECFHSFFEFSQTPTTDSITR